MEEYPGMTPAQANIAITMGEAQDFVNFPSIAKAAATVKLAENMSFGPEDITANLAANTQIGGTGIQPYDPDAVKDLFSTSDANMLKVDADPTLKANAINLVGEDLYNARMRGLKGTK